MPLAVLPLRAAVLPVMVRCRRPCRTPSDALSLPPALLPCRPKGARILLDLLDEAEMPEVVPAYATRGNAGAPLGDVLAAALRDWRRSGGSASAAAELADGNAAAAGVPFVDALPPVEEVVPEALLQPGSSAPDGSGEQQQQQQQPAYSNGPEVLEAEFEERPPEQPADAATAPQLDAGVPLDLIDALASGVDPVAPSTSSACATPRPWGDEDADEALLAARAALGLDSADLQRLVDEAAAKAAQQLNVPFVEDRPAAADSGSQSGTAANAAAANAARKATASGSRKPWEAAAAQATPGGSSASTDPGASASSAASKQGFGRGPAVATPSRKAAKAAAKRRSAASKLADSAAAAAPAPAEQQAEPQQAQQAQRAGEEEARVLPPVDQFVLSKSQLRQVTEKHGLNFEEVLTGLAERGIPMAD